MRAARVFLLLIASKLLWSSPLHDSTRNQIIKPFDKQIFIGPTLRQRTTSFQFTNALSRKNWVRYAPNNAYGVGLRLTLFGVGVEGSVAVPIARRNVERYGASVVRDFQFNSFTHKWFADFYWQKYEGFYLNRSWSPLGFKEVHPQRTDLSLRNSGLSFTYIFNHRRYSMRAPYQFSEHQLRSGGSFMLGFIMNRFRVTSENSIIRTEDQPYFADGFDARATDFVSSAIVLGYGHTLIHRNFFVNLTGLSGPAHHWLKYTGAQPHFDIDLNFYVTYFAAIGYNGDNSFIGITFHSKNSNVRMQDTSVSSTLNTFRLVGGIRLRERGFLKIRPKDMFAKLIQ